VKNPLRWLAGALFNHWGTKILALAIASVFFIVTRDDVSRRFTIPLKVTVDPKRVLLTRLPETVSVELHGSWARMNRLSSHDLGAAYLDLAEARPGPLQIDPASIVMPEGVIFRNMVYERVDLRFDPVVERAVLISANVRGLVHPDYEHTGTLVEPPRWRVRGGSQIVGELVSINTDPIEISGATSDVESVIGLIRPREGIDFASVTAGETPKVTVTVAIKPKVSERRYEVPLTWPEGQEPPFGAPSKVAAVVRGPVPALRQLDAIPGAVIAALRLEKPQEDEPAGAVVIELSLTDAVPALLRASLTLEPSSERVVLPAPPADKALEGAGKDGAGKPAGGPR
jgi:hypothetical protein